MIGRETLATFSTEDFLVVNQVYRTGRSAAYTRRQGLDRETKKELLLKHIRQSGENGCQLKELCEVLPAEKKSQVQLFLRELRSIGRVHSFWTEVSCFPLMICGVVLVAINCN